MNKQLMLPCYLPDSLENMRIRNRVSRAGKKYGIKRIIKKGIYHKLKKCPRCEQTKDLSFFIKSVKHSESVKITSWCISCRSNFNKKYYSLERGRNRWQKKKLRAFKKIQKNIICVRCGCGDIRFLEINHKNGRARNEKQIRIYNEINTGRRKTDDLELLCRPCNHIHYLEMKFGIEIPLKVVWMEIRSKEELK